MSKVGSLRPSQGCTHAPKDNRGRNDAARDELGARRCSELPLHAPLNEQTQPYDVPIDIDQNGTTDITFYAPVDCAAGCAVFAMASQGGGMICLNDGWSAAAISLGGKIGPGATFAAKGGLASGGGSTRITLFGESEPSRKGAWAAARKPMYMGVRFARDGATHYGWVRAQAVGSLSIVLQACGYEATPGVAIAAGAGLEPVGEHASVAPRPAMSIVIALTGLVCAFWWRRATPAHFLR